MIKPFADRRAHELFATGKSRHFPPNIGGRALRKLDQLGVAARLDDLKSPPGNRLHARSGNRAGRRLISINGQWRICFRLHEGDTYEVESADSPWKRGAI
jgi:proteic killer suppression protein